MPIKHKGEMPASSQGWRAAPRLPSLPPVPTEERQVEGNLCPSLRGMLTAGHPPSHRLQNAGPSSASSQSLPMLQPQGKPAETQLGCYECREQG